MKIFEADKVNKKINGTLILNDISFKIDQGERIAITGGNGSGKSSLLKLIGGIYEGSSGKIHRSKIEFGYVPEHFPEHIRFNILNYLILMGKMISKSEADLLKRIKDYAEIFSITEYLNTSVRNCSKGTKQKVGIIQALLKQPQVLLLDEPLTGLDDKSQLELLNQLNILTQEMTIIFTAHESLLIDGLAERVIRMQGGKVISDCTKDKKEKVRMIKAMIPSRDRIAEIPCMKQEFIGENSVEIIVSATESDKVLIMLLERGCSVIELIEKR